MLNHTASRAMYPRQQRLEHVQPESCSQTVNITPLYIPCLKPLQLCSGSTSSKGRNSTMHPLASPQKRAGKKSMRCCRQLFSSDAVIRSTAMEFWLDNMEKVRALSCSPAVKGVPAFRLCVPSGAGSCSK